MNSRALLSIHLIAAQHRLVDQKLSGCPFVDEDTFGSSLVDDDVLEFFLVLVCHCCASEPVIAPSLLLVLVLAL